MIDEIAYSVPICRSGQVPLRWLDKPAREYVVEHHDDGTIEVKPLDGRRYVVRATDDDVLYLKETEPGVDRLEVRHDADGTILLLSPAAAECHIERSGGTVFRYVDGKPTNTPIHEYVRQNQDDVVIVTRGATAERRRGWPWTKKVQFLHDDWDRTHEGLGKRPRELEWQELLHDKSPERRAVLEAERERERALSRAYRERKKARSTDSLPNQGSAAL